MNTIKSGSKENVITKNFSPNGRIIIAPFRNDENTCGADKVIISYYKIASLFTYSIQAKIQKRVFCKWPHPDDGLFDSVWECKQDAKIYLQNFCDQNKLKKAFNRLVPTLTDQLDLFDEI